MILHRFACWPAAIAAALLAAACSSGPTRPAPIESRTRAPAGAERPRAAAPAPAAAPTKPPADAGQAQTAPIRQSSVESRPLEAAPAPAATSPASPAPGASAPIVREPKGLKRPYTDATLAEMRGEPPRAEPPKAEPPKAEPAPPKASAVEPGAGDGAPRLAWPARGRIVQGYAEPSHRSITIGGTAGEPILAAADGRVIFAGQGPRGYGNLVIIKHEADTVTVYGHNRALLVAEGQDVRRGDRIAEMGDTGADRVSLHFEVRRGGKPVDPTKLLPPR